MTRAGTARTALFTLLALLCFAGNSLLCRAALGPRLVDAASFTCIRLVSGALALALLARGRGGVDAAGRRHGSWTSAAVLVGYAFSFSLSYVRIGAAVGALLLFGAVQATMIGWGLVQGERPRIPEIVGLVLALGGLGFLAAPGARAVDPLGAALMIVAGVTWGVYSLRGRTAGPSLPTNAGNFLRSVPLAAAIAVPVVLLGQELHLTTTGVLLATAGGAVTSGVGYTIWYLALPALSAARAAIVQLAVPPLAAAAAVVLLGETLTWRFVGAAAAVIGGVGIAVAGAFAARR
jgi:drug/metabolite transporter (DMT)-like permease